MMALSDYASQGLALSKEANVVDTLHGYFTASMPRLYKTLRRFKLLESELGDVLEIGPFFGYVPFILRPRASSYSVLEGDDPAVYPLKALYASRGMNVWLVDLFELFGPTHAATHSLNFPEASFDTILCWETMEHFNFNPVTFVREIHRILKPGGKAYITVPNKASFQNLVRLIFGRFENEAIDGYYTFENYRSNGKRAFYGFHWREYSLGELPLLFRRAGFSGLQSGTFVSFHAHRKISLARHAARGASLLFGRLLPRFGTNVYLIARK